MTTSTEIKYRKFGLLMFILFIIVLFFLNWTIIDLYPGADTGDWSGIPIYYWGMWVIQPILLSALLILIYYLGSISHSPDINITKGFTINRSMLVILGIIITYFILLLFCFQDFLYYMIKHGSPPANDSHLHWMAFNWIMGGQFHGRHFMYVVIIGWILVAILWYFLLFKIPTSKQEKVYKLGGSSGTRRGGYRA